MEKTKNLGLFFAMLIGFALAIIFDRDEPKPKDFI